MPKEHLTGDNGDQGDSDHKIIIMSEGSGVLQRVGQKSSDFEVPVVGKGGVLQFLLGLLNCIVFGVGVLVAGIINGDMADVLIGVLQLVLPFVGWIWALMWGVLMILECFEKD